MDLRGGTIEVKMKSESADIKKGDLISFEMTEDNFIESVKSESEADIGYQLNVSDPVAIKDFTASWVSFYYDGDYDLADDAKYLYVNTADSKASRAAPCPRLPRQPTRVSTMRTPSMCSTMTKRLS